MTMTTSVRINAPINPTRALDWITEQVGGDPATALRYDARDSYRDDGTKRIGNQIGQGFKALCDVTFHPDGPLPTRTECHEDDEPDWPAAIIEVSFDTAYGYSDEQGRRCGDLHTDILVALRSWLEEQGVTDAWWFAGEYDIDGYQPISDLSARV